MSVDQSSFVAGLSLPQHKGDAASLLQLARSDSYDFCMTCLPHFGSKKARRDVTSLESKWWSTSIVGEVVDETTPCSSQEMITDPPPVPGAKLVAQLAAAGTRVEAEKALRGSITWAGHMNIPAVIVPPIPTDGDPCSSLNYARILSSLALQCSASNVQLWVRTPFTPRAFSAFEVLSRRCNNVSNLGLMLCFGVDSSSNEEEAQASIHISSIGLLHRFLGMNLKCVSFDTCIFLTNKRGYPTLSKSYQMLFTELLRRIGRTVRVLVEGGCRHRPPSTPDANGTTGCLPYLQYLRHLRSRQDVSSVLDTDESALETPYLDHLQSPLQPLGDDLEFSTYEVFEKDPVKYTSYQNAVELALRDKVAMLANAPNNSKQVLDPLTVQDKIKYPHGFTHRVTILILGAGRGPLIRSSLAAVENFNRSQHQLNTNVSSPVLNKPPILLKARVIAIEKNPSAMLFLKSLCAKEDHWDEDTVQIIEADMRHAGTHPELRSLSQEKGIADIIVSELLGSFGDNELSPECLDDVERSGLLKQDCVSIPQRYTSYVAPVSSLRLHSEAKAQAYSPSSPTDGPGGQPYGIQRALETAYVVRCHASSQTHIEKPCFTFFHPKKSNLTLNEQFTQITFDSDPTYGAGCASGYGPFDPSNATLATSTTTTGISIHGFLGTFLATLYKSQNGSSSSTISIAPSSFSRGMFSWFPLYFPLREPLHVPHGATLQVAFWRKVESEKVWYEWCAEVVMADNVLSCSGVHNSNGRSYFVRL